MTQLSRVSPKSEILYGGCLHTGLAEIHDNKVYLFTPAGLNDFDAYAEEGLEFLATGAWIEASDKNILVTF